MEEKIKIPVKKFREMFGSQTSLNGISGRININGLFYPDPLLDNIVSDNIKSDGMIEIPIDDKDKYFNKD